MSRSQSADFLLIGKLLEVEKPLTLFSYIMECNTRKVIRMKTIREWENKHFNISPIVPFPIFIYNQFTLALTYILFSSMRSINLLHNPNRLPTWLHQSNAPQWIFQSTRFAICWRSAIVSRSFEGCSLTVSY